MSAAPSYPVRPPTPKANLVQAFRGEVRASVPLHPLERALVVIASLHLCFLPWAIGTRTPWSQWVSLGFAAVAFVVALWPRRYTGHLTSGKDFTLHTWPRLLRFPVFWIGMFFLGYVLTGALNPAWERVSTNILWYIQGVDHIRWLPSSVAAPFERMNAWRSLVIYGAGWLLACALWTAITRRGAAQAILSVLVANGVLLALIGILQKITGAKMILWFIKSPAHYFHSTFVYKNHAGAYFVLITVLTLALALWHHVRALRRLDRSSPAPVFVFGLIVAASCVFMSASRTAMLLLAAYIVVAILAYVIWRFRDRGGATSPALSALLAVLAAAFIAGAAWFLNLDKSIDQIKRLTTTDQKMSIDSRVMARAATWDMFKDEPLTGWGAGSYRHAFPIYQQHYPDIFRMHGRILSWEYAHNDYVQALAELGAIGFAFPLLALLWALAKFCRIGALAHPAFLLTLIGFGLTLAHAWVDFPLNNAAILTTFCAAWVLTLRWAELESR